MKYWGREMCTASLVTNFEKNDVIHYGQIMLSIMKRKNEEKQK